MTSEKQSQRTLRAKNPPVVMTLSEDEADALASVLSGIRSDQWAAEEGVLESVEDKLYRQLEVADCE